MSGSYKSKKVFVTGADGFIGSHLVEKLVGLGAIVTALNFYNSFDSNGWLDDLDESVLESIDIVHGDIRDYSLMQNLIKGQDVVFHLAALISIPYSYQAVNSYINTNIIGSTNIFNAAKENNIERVIHTSTSEVYGTAMYTPIDEKHPYQGQSPYSASKISADMMAESFVKSFDVPIAILRPFNTYGPRQSERAVIPTIIRQILDDNCPYIKLGDLSSERDLNYVTDTVQAFISIGISDDIDFGKPYNAGSGKKVSIGELVSTIKEIVGSEKDVKQDLSRLRPTASEVKVLLASNERLSSTSGWVPEYELTEGLKHTVEWWDKRFKSGLVRKLNNYSI